MELLGKALAIITDRMSLRKLMFWVVIFLLLWILTPPDIVAFINAKGPAFMPESTLFLMLCISISYLLVDGYQSLSMAALKKRRKAAEKQKLVNAIKTMTNGEREIVFSFVLGGHVLLPLSPDNRDVVSLTAKGIIYQVTNPSRWNGCNYSLNEVYRDSFLTMLSKLDRH